MAVDVRTQPTLGFGRPRALPGAGLPINVTPSTLLNHDVAPDGRFVTVVTEADDGAAAGDRIVLVQNWFEELKRLVPVN